MGIPVTDEAGQRLGHSVTAAKQGIFQVVISRIGMAIPAMGEMGMAGGAQEARREDGLRFSWVLTTQRHQVREEWEAAGGRSSIRFANWSSLTLSWPALPSAIPPVIMNTLEKKDFLKVRNSLFAYSAQRLLPNTERIVTAMLDCTLMMSLTVPPNMRHAHTLS